MKVFPLIMLLTLCIMGCREDDDLVLPGCYVQGSTLELADGTEATLSRIVDRRCPCDVICVWPGYIALEFTIGTDTILHLNDVQGRDYLIDSTNFDPRSHFTARGDEFQILSIHEPGDGCMGRVAGEDFCLEIQVIR